MNRNTSHSDPQPAVGVYTLSLWGGITHRKQIIWLDNDGLKYYEDQQLSLIPGTNSSCKNPTITSIYASPSSGFGYGDYKLFWKVNDTDVLASLKYINGNWQSIDKIKTYYDDALNLPVISENSISENVVAASRYSSIPFNLVVDPVPATILVSTINTPTTLVAGTIYHIKDDLIVTNGAVLTIEPGVEVKLDPGTKITVEYGSKIEANGSEIDPISFRISGSSNWDRIELYGDNNQFEWCVFDGGNTNVEIRSSNNTFNYCTSLVSGYKSNKFNWLQDSVS